MNPFLDRIAKGLLITADDLRQHYKTLVKQTHPDLNPAQGTRVDFDQLKQDYAQALAFLIQRNQPEPIPVRKLALDSREAYWDEFRNLVARGFPVNTQAAAKNRAYSGSIARLAEYLDDRLSAHEFFDRADTEARHLKRSHPRTHWYVLQIFWCWGDWRLTGFAYYRRMAERHLAFIHETLEQEAPTLLALLNDHLREV